MVFAIVTVALKTQEQTVASSQFINQLRKCIPLLGLGCWTPRILWCTSLEAVLESARDTLQVTHATGTSCLSPLSLLAPVV
jgi:hypothetical protein